MRLKQHNYGTLDSPARVQEKEVMRVNDRVNYISGYCSASDILKKNSAFSEKQARRAIVHFS